jgi:outer membrane receptor protein involved in Fe transport
MQKLGFGYGKHTRTESLPVYFVETFSPEGETYLPNKDLKLTRAHHFVASYQKLINDNILVKAEAYYQFINDLPVANNPDKYWSPIFGGVDPYDTLSNIGKGRNYGLELTIQKYFGNQYYFLVTSSLFDSKYKPADGQWHDTKYNINYINNFVGGKEFKWGDNKMLGLNAKVIWSGGKRLTPIDLDASIAEGKAVYQTDQLYTAQAEDYARLDLGIRLHFFSKKTEQVISLDVQNVTNRLNTWFHTYDAKNESIINYPMAGIIPILSYRVEF